MAEMDDDDLLDALGVEAAPARAGSHTRLEERLIAGFEDILRFVETNGRPPQHGEDRDIFERLYAVRLDRLRGIPEARELLEPLSAQVIVLKQQIINLRRTRDLLLPRLLTGQIDVETIS